jgi:histidinol-phosphate aminotransferase
MLNAITDKTRLIFIANPNNPTGTLLAQNEVENFISQLPKTVLCVLDEAYFEFVNATNAVNSLDWLKKYENLIITRTFSKAYGLAGLRVGYGLSSIEIADILNRVRQPFNNNTLALVAAEAALSDIEHLNKTVENNTQGMKQLTDGFSQLGLNWISSAGNFVAVDCGQVGQVLFEKLLHKGVIVRPVGNYEMPNYLRISIGTAEENAFFLKAFSEVL